MCFCVLCVFFFKQKTAYELRISDWSSDVCSSDLNQQAVAPGNPAFDVGGIENGLARPGRSGDKLFVAANIARLRRTARLAAHGDDAFFDRHRDAAIPDADDDFGPDRTHVEPFGTDDERSPLVVRDLDRRFAAAIGSAHV